MSLEEFVRNRKKLPNFGIVRDTLPDISKIMESGKECSYFYFGDEQRKMAGEQLENELKSSVHGAIIKSSMYHGKFIYSPRVLLLINTDPNKDHLKKEFIEGFQYSELYGPAFFTYTGGVDDSIKPELIKIPKRDLMVVRGNPDFDRIITRRLIDSIYNELVKYVRD